MRHERRDEVTSGNAGGFYGGTRSEARLHELFYQGCR